MDFEAKIDRIFERWESKFNELMDNFLDTLNGVLKTPEMNEEVMASSNKGQEKQSKDANRDSRLQNKNTRDYIEASLKEKKLKDIRKSYKIQEKAKKKWDKEQRKLKRQRYTELQQQRKDGVKRIEGRSLTQQQRQEDFIGTNRRKATRKQGEKWHEQIPLKLEARTGLGQKDNG